MTRRPPPQPTMTLQLAATICEQAAALSRDAARVLEREKPPTDRQLVKAFRQLERARELRTDAQRAVIDALRERGLTWEQVGELLGMTRQGAWQRFGKGSHRGRG